DLILLIVDVNDTSIPDRVGTLLEDIQKPALAIVNKIDQVSKTAVRATVDELKTAHNFVETQCISALNGQGVPELIEVVKKYLPAGPPYYPKDIISEQPVRFFVAELIREQLFLQYYQELPYSCTVDIIKYE